MSKKEGQRRKVHLHTTSLKLTVWFQEDHNNKILKSGTSAIWSSPLLSVVDMEIEPTTPVRDLKNKIAELKNIPIQERDNFGIFVKREVQTGMGSEYPQFSLTVTGEAEKIWLDDESVLGDHDLDLDKPTVRATYLRMGWCLLLQDQLLFCRIKRQMLDLLQVSSSMDNSLVCLERTGRAR